MPHFETLERHHNFAITLAFYVIQSGQARRQGRGAAGIVSPAAAGASSAADVSAFLGAGGGRLWASSGIPGRAPYARISSDTSTSWRPPCDRQDGHGSYRGTATGASAQLG